MSKYFDFTGRAKRSEYWWFELFTSLVDLVGSLVFILLDMETVGDLFSLIFLFPSLSVAVRRCHDTGHSGWWIFCPIYNLILMFIESEEGPNKYGEEPID